MPEVASTRAASRWSTRMIPLFLGAAVGYATYVIVAVVCCESQSSLPPAPFPPYGISQLRSLASSCSCYVSSSPLPGLLASYTSSITHGAFLSIRA